MDPWKKLNEMIEATDDEGQPLRTQDPFAPAPIHKASTSAPGGIRATKKQSDQTIDALTTPSANVRRVDQPGFRKASPPPRSPSRPSSPTTPRAPQGPQAKGTGGPSPQYAKPPYRGSYVGQTWTTNDRTVAKNVAWQNRQTGEPGYGKVQSMQKVSMVWDGSDWVPSDQFDKKFGKR